MAASKAARTSSSTPSDTNARGTPTRRPRTSPVSALAKSGTAVLVISSDLPEIIGICDRVIVMRAGQIAGQIRRGATSPLSQEEIMALATGTEQLDA